MRPWQFTFPSRIQFGRGGLRRLGAAVKPLGTRALLVGYRDAAPLADACRAAAKSLADAGLTVAEFFDVPAEPDTKTVAAGAQAARSCSADVIVGLGGGSVIDAAKGIALLAKQGGAVEEYCDTAASPRRIDDALPIVAIPTTAGTGAEVTQIAVFSQKEAKLSLVGPPLRPRVALVDADLTLACPPAVTAACGADALAHAIESCMSRAAQPVATALAMHAVSLIVDHLPRAVAQPDDRDAREALSAAATLAGLALNESGVTMTHAIAHALGAIVGLPHGECVALATPLNLRYNLEASRPVYAQLARVCGVTGASPESLADDFIAHVCELLRSIGLRERIAVPAGEREPLATRLAACAFATTPTPLRLNPRPIEEATLTGLIGKELFAVGSDERQ